jgi:hypothetical protein
MTGLTRALSLAQVGGPISEPVGVTGPKQQAAHTKSSLINRIKGKQPRAPTVTVRITAVPHAETLTVK